jgi:lipopolysaccharide/colanic/teichoic acid biosynthesis glycosyltransferase
MMRDLFGRTVALVALVVLAPLLLLIALAVLTTSRGPVVFRQVRVGLDGRPFEILKFRTMVNGAEHLAANISPEGDPRVTAVGRWLRAWYLDELPQLVNVLKGDMDLVGPRPETPEYVALYTPAERRVLSVRPGLAGPSTLAHMDEAQCLAEAADAVEHYERVLLHQRVAMDMGYLEHRSIRYDVALLCRQVVAIARRH